MKATEITSFLDTVRSLLSQRFSEYKEVNDTAKRPQKSNVLFEALFNYNFFEYNYVTNFKTSTVEFYETRIILESFLYLKSIHSILFDRNKLNKILKVPTKEELIDKKINELKAVLDIEKIDIDKIKNSLRLEEDTFLPDDLPKDQFHDLVSVYKKNKNFLDYTFYVNMRNIFSKYRKNYWKDLLTFLQIIEECFPSALDVHFDLHYSEIENIRNRFRGYEKKLPSQVVNIMEGSPLKF